MIIDFKTILADISDPTIVRKRFQRYWEYFQRLKCHGFKLVASSPNLVPVNLYTINKKIRSQCYELVWVNNKNWTSLEN